MHEVFIFVFTIYVMSLGFVFSHLTRFQLTILHFTCSLDNIDIPDSEEEDEDAIIERRRREREALMKVC